MELERTIFNKYQPNFQLLQKYGFVKKPVYFYYQKNFFNNKFQAQVFISDDQKITGKVIDLDINDEYLPIHSIQTGKFVDQVRNEYVGILKGIRDQCFTLTSIYPQGMQHYWLIPANPKYYDIMNAFNTTDTIIWKQSTKVQVGDIVFIYVGSPISAIIFECQAQETNIPCQYRSKNLSMTHVMRIQKLKRYPDSQFNFKNLQKYGVKAIRGPRHVPEELLKVLMKNSCQ